MASFAALEIESEWFPRQQGLIHYLLFCVMASCESRKRVRVFARTRPTGNFVHDRIGIADDGKVTCLSTALLRTMLTSVLDAFVQTINIHQPKNEHFGVINHQVEGIFSVRKWK